MARLACLAGLDRASPATPHTKTKVLDYYSSEHQMRLIFFLLFGGLQLTAEAKFGDKSLGSIPVVESGTTL